MDDPKDTDATKPAEGQKKPIVDQLIDVAADAAAAVVASGVKALGEGAKKAVKKRTPAPVKKAVASVTKVAKKVCAPVWQW